MESYYKQNKKLITDILDILEGHFGKNVEFVVHDLSLARSFGTDALLMDHGRQIAHGPAAQVLTPERLNAVYGMDVPAWMRSLYAQWAEDNEKAPLPGELARRSRD